MANISECFDINFICLRIFGIMWPGRKSSKYYKYYAGIYLFLTLVVYNVLIMLNLYYTPRKIELMIREVVYIFAEVAATAKFSMIFFKQNSLVEAFHILDCEAFKGEDEFSRQIVKSHVAKYKVFWKLNAFFSNTAFFIKTLIPIFKHVLFNSNIDLPIYNYYFLDQEIIDQYFVLLWIYQFIGILGHMMYNICIDSLIAGLILKAIAQINVVDHELRNLKSEKNREGYGNIKLNKCLRHYEMLLDFTSVVQDIISVTMFVQFSVAAGSICAILCSLLLPNTMGELTSLLPYMSMYAFAMILQIFVPAYLGTQLSNRSQQLVSAAYNSEWIPRSGSFKSSLKLFMQRANTAILLTGYGFFPLTLDTFTSMLFLVTSGYSLGLWLDDLTKNHSMDAAACMIVMITWCLFATELKYVIRRVPITSINGNLSRFAYMIMKTAYSFFTLVRNVQDRDNSKETE